MKKKMKEKPIGKEFWEEQHRMNSSHNLTGSSGIETWTNLSVTDLIKPSKVILDIGVGFGHCSKALVDAKLEVYSLDIAEAALDRVRNVVKGVWLDGQAKEIPSGKFDLAISYIVAQHITNDALAIQTKEIIRTLKPGGLYAMQFAYPLEGWQDTTGIFCRYLSDMDALVRKAGGKIVFAKHIEDYENVGWYVIHIKHNN